MKELHMALGLPVARIVNDDNTRAKNLYIISVNHVQVNGRISKLSLLSFSLLRSPMKQKAVLREAYRNKKFLPLDLHPKKTKAIRQRHKRSLSRERDVERFNGRILK
ncbi:hypothetical protein OIU85_004715 [Salix viminalis]|uniref:Uncharacterized protein n=1 Tax=Salix viminalis TaxID=40686 RepID=A0A9Q0PTT1_SALVM|nr:hypothetical protein OIU85_004715 [Salix viminalis]